MSETYPGNTEPNQPAECSIQKPEVHADSSDLFQFIRLELQRRGWDRSDLLLCGYAEAGETDEIHYETYAMTLDECMLAVEHSADTPLTYANASAAGLKDFILYVSVYDPDKMMSPDEHDVDLYVSKDAGPIREAELLRIDITSWWEG